MKRYLCLLFIFIPFWTSAQITGEIKIGKEQLRFARQDGYDRIVSSHEFIRKPGLPELLVVVKSYVIPSGATHVTLRSQITRSEKLQGSYWIYPVREPQVNGPSAEQNRSDPDRPLYSLTDSFPGKTIEILSDNYCQGYRVVTIAAYPLLFIPNVRELYLNDISFSLDYEPGISGNDQGAETSLNRFNLAKAFVKSMVENPADVERYSAGILKAPEVTDLNRFSVDGMRRSINVRETIIPDFVIITNEKLKSSFQKLADWKIKKGIPTIIKTVEEIEADYTGSYLFDKIRNYLLDVQNRWGRNSLSILLGGDVDVIPSRVIKSQDLGESRLQVSDLYYVMNTFTWTPQKPTAYPGFSNISSYLGRIPVSTPEEATTIVNKILNYEKARMGLNNYTYFSNFLVADAFKSPGGNKSGFMKVFNDICKLYRNSTTQYWYMFDDFGCGHDYSVHDESMDYDTTYGEELNKNNFLSAFQNGRKFKILPEQFHFIYHDDHSYSTNMGTSANMKSQCITITDVDNLVDNPYCKIIFSNGCHPADFSKECMAERFLKKEEGGAVAFIGNTDVGWVGHNFHFTQFMKSLFTDIQESPLQKSMGCS